MAAHKAHVRAYFAADEAHTQALQAAKSAGRFKGLDAEAYAALHSQLIEPFNAALERDDELHDACGKLGEQIIAIQPKTLDGIAVLARVCQFESRQAWEAPKSREYDEDVLVALVDGILAVAATA
ncbi:hypothetical protein [Methylobacterium haplocladii]|uniref:hypothetical protein n=1 Tax=Methylobacterium haplocladii TaxID=1176176 RepID=UPI0011BDC62A|nr:hypothetical protein [Methylobacterium haplocladii]